MYGISITCNSFLCKGQHHILKGQYERCQGDQVSCPKISKTKHWEAWNILSKCLQENVIEDLEEDLSMSQNLTSSSLFSLPKKWRESFWTSGRAPLTQIRGSLGKHDIICWSLKRKEGWASKILRSLTWHF